MHPEGTRGYRASIVGRARFVEDLLLGRAGKSVEQYVILGAGLDTFAQRNPEAASRIKVFEIDQPETQTWKRQRLLELGMEVPKSLHFVPVDFESGESWTRKLANSGFDRRKPALIASVGVSMYLTKDAVAAMLREISALAPGSLLAMTFILTMDLIDPVERPQHEMVYEKARAAGTPFLSFFRPEEILALARESGFRKTSHVSRQDLIRRYFKNRKDGFAPSSGEEFLIAET